MNVECGKQACLTIYVSDNCFWCDVAKEMVDQIMRELGLDEWIQVLLVKATCDLIVAVPTLDICNDQMVGKPDEWELRSKIINLGLRAASKEVVCAR